MLTSKARPTRFASALLAAAAALALGLSACGDDDGGDDSARGGAGGSPAGGRAGASGVAGSVPEPVPCGDVLCPALTVATLPPVAPCCADESESQCGLDTSLLAEFGAMPERTCEPRNQPGQLDDECPVSAPFDTGSGLEIPPFRGCCRAETGTCGYLVDRVVLFEIGLGCIDSTPFLEGETPASCGDNSGGASSGGAGGD